MNVPPQFPWATALIVTVFAIVTIVGGAVVIWGDPGTLSFEEYLDALVKFGIAIGLLAIGRGIALAAKYMKS